MRPAAVLAISLVLVVGGVAAGGCNGLDQATRDLGAACLTDEDCNQRCLPSPRWPRGFCSLRCAVTTDCPVGSDCVDRGADGHVCLFLCLDERDCSFLEGSDQSQLWRCERPDERAIKVCGPRPQEPSAAPRGLAPAAAGWSPASPAPRP